MESYHQPKQMMVWKKMFLSTMRMLGIHVSFCGHLLILFFRVQTCRDVSTTPWKLEKHMVHGHLHKGCLLDSHTPILKNFLQMGSPCFTLWIVEVITSLLEEHGQGGACAENDPRLGGWIDGFGCCFFWLVEVQNQKMEAKHRKTMMRCLWIKTPSLRKISHQNKGSSKKNMIFSSKVPGVEM